MITRSTAFLVHSALWVLTSTLFGVEASGQSATGGARFRLLVERGETAPGTGGLVFEHFGEHPGAGEFRARPTIDSDGRVAFTGLVGDGDVETNDVFGGIFRLGDQLEAIALAGEPAPGSSSSFEDFGFRLGITPRIHDGRVTFIALTQDALTAGVWGDRFGPLVNIVLEGQLLPDTPPDGTLFDFATTSRRNNVLINGAYRTDVPSTSLREGLWRDGDGTLVTVAVDGQAAPGIEGAVFSDAHSSAQVGPLGIWNASPDGRLVFNGYVDAPHVDETNDEGLWVETASGLELVVREGERVPDATNERFGVKSGFKAFGAEELQPARNLRGTIVFGVSVWGPQFTRARTVWLRRDGQLERIATGFLPLDSNPLGDPAPGYGPEETFSRFELAQLNERDQLAFGAFVDTGDFFDQAFGIFWTIPGFLDLVVGEELPSPVLPEATTEEIVAGPLTDAGRFFYTARLSGPGVTLADDTVLVLVEPDGRQRILVREGDAFDLEGDDRGPRTFAELQLGLGTARDDTVVLEVFFGDGSAGLVSITPGATMPKRLSKTTPKFNPPGR